MITMSKQQTVNSKQERLSSSRFTVYGLLFTLYQRKARGFALTPNKFGVTSRSEGGFTLIEALVALSIIALAVIGPLSLAATSLSAAQVARDQLTAYYLAQEGIEIVRNVRDTDRLNGATQWTDGWFNCFNSGSGDCAVRVDGSKSLNDPNRIQNKDGCVWNSGETEKAIKKCLTDRGNEDTLLFYDARQVGGVADSERGLFGYTSDYGEQTDFRRIVLLEQIDAATIKTTSVVAWPTSFGSTRKVVLTEYLKHLQ